MRKIGRSWGKTSFRNTTTEICYQSGCQESLRGRVYDSTSATIKIPFYLNHTQSGSPVKGHTRGISGRVRRKTGSLRPASSLEDSISLRTEFVIRALLYEPFVITCGRNINNCIFDLMWLLICFIGFQFFLVGCILGAISGSTYLTFVDVIWSKWNWKLNDKREIPLGSPFWSLVEGLIVAW